MKQHLSTAADEMIELTYWQYIKDNKKIHAKNAPVSVLSQLIKKKRIQEIGLRRFEYTPNQEQDIKLIKTEYISIENDFLAEYYDGLTTPKVKSFFL